MRETLAISAAAVLPTVESVLRAQGIPPWKKPDDRILRLADEALAAYRATAAPAGLLMEIPGAEFEGVFDGERVNHPDSPVGPIARSANDLALFAVTLGQRISDRISLLFESKDYAAGSLLDAAASEGAELAAALVERSFRERLSAAGRFRPGLATLRFSPGYCGWDIRGQRNLFRALTPGTIGLSLSESCLMQPLKSVSGVMVSGRKEIFDFEDVFSFCRDCSTHTCRERIKDVMNQ